MASGAKLPGNKAEAVMPERADADALDFLAAEVHRLKKELAHKDGYITLLTDLLEEQTDRLTADKINKLKERTQR
jgi:hypothetical protein